MYEKGLIKLTIDGPCAEYLENWTCEHGGHETVMDSRSESGNEKMPVNIAFLPHSCSEWVIGGREQIEAMIADLQAVLEQADEYQPPEPKPVGKHRRHKSVTVTEFSAAMSRAVNNISDQFSTQSSLLTRFRDGIRSS